MVDTQGTRSPVWSFVKNVMRGVILQTIVSLFFTLLFCYYHFDVSVICKQSPGDDKKLLTLFPPANVKSTPQKQRLLILLQMTRHLRVGSI